MNITFYLSDDDKLAGQAKARWEQLATVAVPSNLAGQRGRVSGQLFRLIVEATGNDPLQTGDLMKRIVEIALINRTHPADYDTFKILGLPHFTGLIEGIPHDVGRTVIGDNAERLYPVDIVVKMCDGAQQWTAIVRRQGGFLEIATPPGHLKDFWPEIVRLALAPLQLALAPLQPENSGWSVTYIKRLR